MRHSEYVLQDLGWAWLWSSGVGLCGGTEHFGIEQWCHRCVVPYGACVCGFGRRGVAGLAFKFVSLDSMPPVFDAMKLASNTCTEDGGLQYAYRYLLLAVGHALMPQVRMRTLRACSSLFAS